MPITTSGLDPVNVAVAIAALIFGPTLAGIVGPYAVIFLGSTVGAAWSLGRRKPGPRTGAAWYFLRLNATAALVTVSLANIAAQWVGTEESHWLLAPIALAVGLVGDDWPRTFRWLCRRLGRLIERRTGTDSKSSSKWGDL